MKVASSLDQQVQPDFKADDIIHGADIAQVLNTDVSGKGTQWVEIRDGLEAEVEEIGIGRYKIREVIKVQRAID